MCDLTFLKKLLNHICECLPILPLLSAFLELFLLKLLPFNTFNILFKSSDLLERLSAAKYRILFFLKFSRNF
jgi:hypothetical protein